MNGVLSNYSNNLSVLGKNELLNLRSTLLKELEYIRGNRRNEIHDNKRRVLTYMGMVYIDIQKRVNEVWGKLTLSCKEDAIRRMNFIISLLKQRQEKISEEEMKSFDREFSRLHRVFDLLLVESSNNFRVLNSLQPVIQKKVRDCHFKLEQDIYSTKLFTADINEKVGTVIKEMSLLLKNVVTDEERVMVHTAMAQIFGSIQSTNRWYKCGGCGDVYCVENCGAVNQIIRCRHCRTTIGDHSRINDPNMARALQNIR